MAVKRGLGRGLEVLINDGSKQPTKKKTTAKKEKDKSDTGILKISISNIVKNSLQPRHVFEQEAIDNLAESIKERGVLQPLLVRTTTTKNKYELIAGERRLRASGQAGLKEVPVIILEAEDQDSLELALVENLQREDLNIIEEAAGYQLLADSYDLTQDKIASRVGKSRATVANAMRLLKLPEEVQALISSNQLSTGHAKLLSGLDSVTEQILLAKRTVLEGISVRGLEKLISQAKKAPRKPRAVRNDIPGSHLSFLSDQLHAYFGTSVKLQPCRTYANGKKGKGSIEIDFYSTEDLTRILDILGIEAE
jgi:ParB family chromosome partitioning protein